MYHTRGNAPISGQKCAEPDWSQVFVDRTEELRVALQLSSAIMEFIQVLNPSLHDNNSFATLLGTLSIDIQQRKAELDRISEKLNDA